MAAMETTRRRVAIAGIVTDAVTGRGLAGAIVKITAKNLQAVTRNDGSYFFTDLGAGKYTLNAAAPDQGSRYGAVKITNVIVQNAADNRPVFDGKANVALPPTRVSGTVKRSSDGKPLQGVAVKIRGSEAKTVTDENGKYLLTGFHAGAPTVEASGAGYAAAARKATLTAGAESIADFSLS